MGHIYKTQQKKIRGGVCIYKKTKSPESIEKKQKQKKSPEWGSQNSPRIFYEVKTRA